VKKVLLDSWDQRANGKILREVTTLSRLHHQHVVRYFQAWIEGFVLFSFVSLAGKI
jgi:translation initiation factor 2-alpha kinase 4